MAIQYAKRTFDLERHLREAAAGDAEARHALGVVYSCGSFGIAIDLIEEATHAVFQMPTMFLIPFVKVALLGLFLLYWIAGAVCVFFGLFVVCFICSFFKPSLISWQAPALREKVCILFCSFFKPSLL